MSGYNPGGGRSNPLFGTPRVATRTNHGRRVPVRHTAAGSRPKSAPKDVESHTTNAANKYDRMHSDVTVATDTVAPERRASPIRRSTAVEDEGSVMTKSEFINKYGGLREWEESHPAASIHDHHWFQEKLAEEEERGEMMTRKYRVPYSMPSRHPVRVASPRRPSSEPIVLLGCFGAKEGTAGVTVIAGEHETSGVAVGAPALHWHQRAALVAHCADSPTFVWRLQEEIDKLTKALAKEKR